MFFCRIAAKYGELAIMSVNATLYTQKHVRSLISLLHQFRDVPEYKNGGVLIAGAWKLSKQETP
jgi:hypothetical protein